MARKRSYRMAMIAAGALALQGRTTAGPSRFASGASIAVGAGIGHTTSGVAYKTFTASRDELHSAALTALRRMEPEVVKGGPVNDTHATVATAMEGAIEIELEALSGRASRMRVVANAGAFVFKDAGTATEIIVRAAATLDDIARRRPHARSPAMPES